MSRSSSSPAGDLAHRIETQLAHAWLPRIYRERILKMRTRSYEFPSTAKSPAPEIQHTLLGIELKIGRRRMLCPDLATARYLAVFARIGCRAAAIPYDITKVSRAADELESSLCRMLLLADQLASARTTAFRARLRGLLIGKVRTEIADAGAGARMPVFKEIKRKDRR